MTSNPKARSIHSEPVVEHENLEKEVFDWVNMQRKAAVAVSINATIA